MNIKLFCCNITKKTFESFLEDIGLQEKEMKSMMKLFKEECKKYGKEIK